jgi:hypothetical protein
MAKVAMATSVRRRSNVSRASDEIGAAREAFYDASRARFFKRFALQVVSG